MRIATDLTITRINDTDYEVTGSETADFTIFKDDGTYSLVATFYGPGIDPSSGLPHESYLTVVGPTVKAVIVDLVKRVVDWRIAEEFAYLDNEGRTEVEATEGMYV